MPHKTGGTNGKIEGILTPLIENTQPKGGIHVAKDGQH
jgi:hypothetical protein